MKRFFDLTVSILGLLLLAPIIIIIGLIVKIKLGSPILFKQLRPGKNTKPFKLYKFRTMTNQRDSQGNLLPDSIRLKKTGQLLRKYSLDELPQLFNVLKGDISLVGPRPLLMEYLELYDDFQMRRHEVKPGITGWAQINGRNAISWEERFEMDVWYVENQSFLLDMKILFTTIQKVIKSEGVNQEGQSTVQYFKGNEEYEK